MLKEKNTVYIIYAVLMATLYFVFFQHLDSFHIRNWDESMFEVNAYEMSHNHQFVVPYYKNLPDSTTLFLLTSLHADHYSYDFHFIDGKSACGYCE